jgi:hypothetical protein
MTVIELPDYHILIHFYYVLQVGNAEYIIDYRDVSPVIALATAVCSYANKRLVLTSNLTD